MIFWVPSLFPSLGPRAWDLTLAGYTLACPTDVHLAVKHFELKANSVTVVCLLQRQNISCTAYLQSDKPRSPNTKPATPKQIPLPGTSTTVCEGVSRMQKTL